MTELTTAAERVARAVERLENAARRRVSGTRVERERLGADLRRAKSEIAQLETVADGVSLRLDDAIDRLRSALDG
jgi:hypothetical protein